MTPPSGEMEEVMTHHPPVLPLTSVFVYSSIFVLLPSHVADTYTGWWCGSLLQPVCTTNLKPVGLLVDVLSVTVSVYIVHNCRSSYGDPVRDLNNFLQGQPGGNLTKEFDGFRRKRDLNMVSPIMLQRSVSDLSCA
jgi:hypothetical protein